MSKGFYIFGLQRSGTTFFEYLLKDNFDCYCLNGPGQWKHSHSIPELIYQKGFQLDYKCQLENPLFIIYKNPYMWIESVLYRGSADMLDTTGKKYKLQQGPGTAIGHDQIRLENLCQLLQDYVNNWWCLVDYEQVRPIKYEWLLNSNDLGLLMSDFSKLFEPKNKQWSIPKPGSLFMSEGFTDEDKSYYISEKPTRLTPEYIKIINNCLDDITFRRLNCRPLLTND